MRALGFSAAPSLSSRAAAISGIRRSRAWRRERGERRLAKAALGRVVDALEGEIVVGLGRAADIGERIAHFGALVEARAADDAVGQAHFDEPLLELAHLERGAHQHRHVGGRDALALRRLDLLADVARLLRAVPDADDRRLLADRGIRIERLAEPRAIVRDEPGGRAQDVAGRAIVAFEPDDFRARKIALEPQNVVDVGAAPAVDRLIVVADAADVAMPGGEQPQPQILDVVGVLIFVDQDVAEAALILFEQDRDCRAAAAASPPADRRNRRRSAPSAGV